MNKESKTIEIEIYGEKITYVQSLNVNMGWGIKDDLSIIFPKFMNEVITNKKNDNRRTISQIARYTANKLYKKILTEGDSVIKEIKELGFEVDDYIRIEYLDKVAIIRTFLSNKTSLKGIDINPFYEIDTDGYGMTITPGNMSDVIFYNNYGVVQGYTKDCYRYQFGIIALFVRDFCKNIKDILLNNKDIKDFEEYNFGACLYLNKEIIEIKKHIKEVIENKVTKNRSININKVLSSEGENIKDLLKKYNIRYKTLLYSDDLLKVCLDLGKMPNQVKNYIDKNL